MDTVGTAQGGRRRTRHRATRRAQQRRRLRDLGQAHDRLGRRISPRSARRLAGRGRLRLSRGPRLHRVRSRGDPAAPPWSPPSSARTSKLGTTASLASPAGGQRQGGDLEVHVEAVSVVHVVRKSVVCAPRKTHKPLTITVDSGQPRSNENRNCAAGSRKVAGYERRPLFFAKVRVAGSNPVFRSKCD